MARRGIAPLFVVVLIFALLMHWDIPVNNMTPIDRMVGKQYESSYISHQPFNITSDADFGIQSWPGNGSETSPYLIQNLNITTSNSTCIWISNTTSHFIIEGCIFSSQVSGSIFGYAICPITLANVSNGVINGNLIPNSIGGISGNRLSNCTISNNNFTVQYQGISLTNSNSTIILNNYQGYESCEFAMNLYHCTNSTIEHNDFMNITKTGIYAWHLDDVDIIENTFISNLTPPQYMPSGDGIEIHDGKDCWISKNNITNFSWFGIVATGADFLVDYNSVSLSQTGMYVSANSSVICNNTLSKNLMSIVMVQTNNTKVHDNLIEGIAANSGRGITIECGENSRVFLNHIQNVELGISLQGAYRFDISNNVVTDGRYGLRFAFYSFYGSPERVAFDCDIVENTFDGGGVYSTIENYGSWNFSSIVFHNNTVNGRLIGLFANLDHESINGAAFGQLLLVNCYGTTINGGEFYGVSSDVIAGTGHDPGQASAIILLNCSNCVLFDVRYHNNTIGVSLQYSTYCEIFQGLGSSNSWAAAVLWHSDNTFVDDVYFRNNLKGLVSTWSWGGRIFSNLFWENDEAIVLSSSPNCTLFNNEIFRNSGAIFLAGSDRCIIRRNTIYWNSRGVLLNSSSDCLLTRNNIYNNTGVGIFLDFLSDRNEIYENAFAYNAPNAICEGSSNHWDNQIDTGNWWSDYTGTGPYIINVNNQDNYPNWNETTSTQLTTDHPIPTFSAGLAIAAGVVMGIIALILVRSEKKPGIPVD